VNSLTADQKRLVRTSFESLEEYSDSVVQLFYGRLFEIAPQVRPLFRVDITNQSRKLLDMLTTIVSAIDNFEALRPRLEDLGYKHVAYGAKPEHYNALRIALLWAMATALDLEFDKETKAAWGQLLEMVSSAMIAGANRTA
jgi:hemoglobin-like flavoprotein